MSPVCVFIEQPQKEVITEVEELDDEVRGHIVNDLVGLLSNLIVLIFCESTDILPYNIVTTF